MSTLAMTHESISKALCDNSPLSDDQRAALLTLVADDKRNQNAWDLASQWQPIAEAPDDALCVVAWRDPQDGEERHDLDCREDGCWQRWQDHAEHVEMIGGHGVSYTAPYTHFMRLGPIPAAPAAATERDKP